MPEEDGAVDDESKIGRQTASSHYTVNHVLAIARSEGSVHLDGTGGQCLQSETLLMKH